MTPEQVSKINGLFKQIDDLTSTLDHKDRLVQQLESTVEALTKRLMTEQDLREVVDKLTPKTRSSRKK
jgi:flagellar biosynthesis chaperone FliJ